MSNADLVSTIAHILDPWAFETKSYNATIARDDATDKATQIVEALAALDNRAGDAGEGLRPCPHCGGPAKFITPMGEWVGKGKGHNGGAYEANRARYVCGRLYEDGPTECASWKSYDTEEQARAAWNDRPATSAPAVDERIVREVLARILEEQNDSRAAAAVRNRYAVRIDGDDAVKAMLYFANGSKPL